MAILDDYLNWRGYFENRVTLLFRVIYEYSEEYSYVIIIYCSK